MGTVFSLRNNMKTQIINKVEEENVLEYPYIGRLIDSESELIVLFKDEKTGVVLYSTSDDWSVGDIGDSFDQHKFE